MNVQHKHLLFMMYCKCIQISLPAQSWSWAPKITMNFQILTLLLNYHTFDLLWKFAARYKVLMIVQYKRLLFMMNGKCIQISFSRTTMEFQLLTWLSNSPHIDLYWKFASRYNVLMNVITIKVISMNR